MGSLYVPILKMSNLLYSSLYSVTCKKQDDTRYSVSKFNGYSDNSVSFFNEKLKAYFTSDTFSFKILKEDEIDPKRRTFKFFSGQVTSISLGLFCAAYKTAKNKAFREKYDSITVTGDFRIINGKVQLVDVRDIKEKFQIVQDYARKNADKNHLFIYISSEEIIPEGIQENNVLVIRYDSNFPVECVFADIFKDIKEDISKQQKDRNEFIETRSFINLKKKVISDKSCNCHIIKGESNTGKSMAAEALCKYLVNSQTISDYVWFNIGDNEKLLELLRTEKEEQVNSAFDIEFGGEDEKRNCVKDAYHKDFEKFDRLLHVGKRCAIIVDNIERDIVDEVISFFDRNYPMESNRYNLIITSWEGSRINRIESSIRICTINISDISLDFNEVRTIADSIIRINDYSKKYYEAPENLRNDLLNMLRELCGNYPGYFSNVLSSLNKYSIKETLERYAEQDIRDLSAIERILKISFEQVDFLSRVVLFTYLQIKNFDEALKTDKIIEILKHKIFNNTQVIDYYDIRSSLNVLQPYSFLREIDIDRYEIKDAVRNFTVFSKAISSELQAARDLIITPERKVEYAIEEKKLDEFKLYIDMISEKETLNKVLIKLCKFDSSLEFFESLLSKEDVDVNYVCNNETPLRILARDTSNTRVMDFLINKEADRNKCLDGEMLLHYAARNEDSTMLRHVLEHDYYGDINEVNKKGATALHFACKNGKNEKTTELLLNCEADWTMKDNSGNAPLHYAAANEGSTILRYILEHNCYSDINEVNKKGATALHAACRYGKDEKTIELLREYGADMNARSNEGKTLLHYAAANEDSTVLRYILKHHYYGDINEADKDGWTVLHYACRYGKDEKTIGLLLECGADRGARSNGGNTLLHCAAMNKDSTVLKYILEHHCYDDINESENVGNTALFHTQSLESFKLLLEHGSDPEIVTSSGNTILHAAALSNRKEIVKYILEHLPMIDPSQKNSDGKTATELATDDEITKLFEE